MSTIERDLERFLRKEIFQERDKPLSKLVLFHTPSGGKANEVEVFKIREGMTSDELPTLIEEILSRAQGDANGAGGVQRYVLRSLVKGDSAPTSRFSFRLRGNDEEFDEAFEDGANQKGLLTQLMRHNEAIMRVAMTGLGTANSILGRQLEASNERLETALGRIASNMELIEKMRGEEHDRAMESYKLEKSEERKAQMMETLKVLGPVVVNKLAGQKLLPSADPMMVSLKEMVATLDQTQFEKILSALKPDQAIALISIIQSFQAQDKKPETES